MAYKGHSASAAIEAVAQLTNTGKRKFQFTSVGNLKNDFKITHFAFHDKDVNYQLLDPNNIDENDNDILSLPIPEPNPDDSDLKFDEEIFPGTLVSDKVDYGFTPLIPGNQLTDEEIQARLRRFYARGTVKEFNPTTASYSVLNGVQFLIQSNISTFSSGGSFNSSTATAVANDNGVFNIENLLESSNINIIPISPTGRSLVFTPPVYKISSMAKSYDNIEFVGVETAAPTKYRFAGTIYDTTGAVLRGENVSIIINPWSTVPAVDKSNGQFNIPNIPGGNNYTVNAYNPKYTFITTSNSLTGYSIQSLSADYLQLNFTATPIAFYPLRISGYVVDENNNGIGGITIKNSQNSVTVTTSTQPGQQGYYIIDNLSGFNGYSISVWPEDLTQTWEFKTPTVQVINPFTSVQSNVSFTASPFISRIDISGAVKDSGGIGVPGVLMTISPEGKSTVTDSSGRYLFTNVNKNAQQHISPYRHCYIFDQNPLVITTATMSPISNGSLLTTSDIVASLTSTNIFGTITYNSSPLTMFSIRKEGIGTQNYGFVNNGGAFTLTQNVTNSTYTIIPYSTDSNNDYDFTPKYSTLSSYTGSNTGITYSASSEQLGTSTYNVVINMYDATGTALTNSSVLPFVNKRRILDRIAINDSQVITWNSSSQCVLTLQRGNYYLSLDGQNYKPLNSLDITYDSLTANLTANLSATVDINSYIISGYVTKREYDNSLSPFANIKVSVNNQDTYTDSTGYYFITDVLNTPCTVPAVVLPHTPVNPVCTFTPTGYVYTVNTLTGNKSNVNFEAAEDKTKKLFNFNIIREDGKYAKNPITFVINNQQFSFGGNASGASFLVPINTALTGWDINGILQKPNLTESNTVPDDINYGSQFERMRELTITPNNFTVNSFTGSSTSISLTVTLKSYQQVGGNLWLSATGNTFSNSNVNVILKNDNGKLYTAPVASNGTYLFPYIEATSGTGSVWYAYLDYADYYAVSGYVGSTLISPTNMQQVVLSSTGSKLNINFLMNQVNSVTISGDIRNSAGNLLSGVELNLIGSSYLQGREYTSTNGYYSYSIPSGSIINRLYMENTSSYQSTLFTNSINNTGVFSLSSPLTSNMEVNWVYADQNLQFRFLFAYQDFNVTGSPGSTPVSNSNISNTQTQQTIVPANNPTLFGSQMYNVMISDPIYTNFTNYFMNITSKSNPQLAITDVRMMHHTFGGIYVYDPSYATTINHWNIEKFLINHFRTTGHVITTSAGSKVYTPVQNFGTLNANAFMTQQELDALKNGYSYEDIMMILDNHYDSLYLVVDLRNQNVIAANNPGIAPPTGLPSTQPSLTGTPSLGGSTTTVSATTSSIVQTLQNISTQSYIVSLQDDLKWAISYITNYNARMQLTPGFISDDIALRIYNIAPTDPIEVASIRNSYGVDFTPGSVKYFSIQMNTGGSAGSGGSTPKNLDISLFGNYELKQGDIYASIYEVMQDGTYILVPPATNIELICGFRRVASTTGFSYNIDNVSHPSLQTGKDYVIALNYEFDVNPMGTFPYNHKFPTGGGAIQSLLLGQTTTLQPRLAVIHSIWDHNAIDTPVEKWFGGTSRVYEEETSITKIDDVSQSPSYHYKIGLMANTIHAPIRRMLSDMRNIDNPCSHVPEPISDTYYWIAYAMKYYDSNYALEIGNDKLVNYSINLGGITLTSLRDVIARIVNNNNYTYQQKEDAINSHIDIYIGMLRNVYIKAVTAYRENKYIRTYWDSSIMTEQQKSYMANLKYKIIVPVEVADLDLFNEVPNNQLRTSSINGDLPLTFKKNNNNIRTAIRRWIENKTEALTIKVQFTQQEIADIMNLCIELVEPGSKISNVPVNQQTQFNGAQITNKNFVSPFTINGNNSHLYVRQFANFFTNQDITKTNSTNQYNFTIRTDFIILDALDVPAFKQLVETEFVPFQQSSKNTYWEYSSGNPAGTEIRGGWIDNVNDWLYLYDKVFSKLPTTTNTKWSSVLTTKTTQTATLESTAFESFVKPLPNTLKYQWKKYDFNGANYTSYRINWNNVFVVPGYFDPYTFTYGGGQNMVDFFTTKSTIKWAEVRVRGWDYQQMYVGANRVVTTTLVPPLVVPQAFANDNIDGWSESQMQQG